MSAERVDPRALRGRVLVRGPRALHDLVPALLERVCARARDGGEFVCLANLANTDPLAATHYLKGGPLRGSSARRHGFARLLLRRAPPRLREYDNLRMLRGHDVDVPVPVLAAARVSGARVLAQFLLTERVTGAGGYELLITTPNSPLRARALDALARTIAALHAAGVEHVDPFARNFLYTTADGEPRPVVLDLWRGGRASVWRRPIVRTFGAARDVGRLCTDLAPELTRAELERFFAIYLEQRERNGAALDPERFAQRVTDAYRREAARQTREPHRRRGKAPLDPRWSAPVVRP
jgi:hypothetical protein